MDVGIVFRVDVLEFRVEGGIAFTGESGIALINLDEGISFMEVGVVVICRQPAGGGVGDFVGLGSEGFALDKAAEGFGIAEVFLERDGWSYPGAQFLLVIMAGEAVWSGGILVVDFLAQAICVGALVLASMRA